MNDSTLTLRQLRIVTLLTQGKTITEAAATENIHRNTIANWRRTIPAFARELDLALSEQRQYWQEQATRLAPQAMQAIEDCLTNPNSSPSLRFRAATYILKMATTAQPPQLRKAAQLHNDAQPHEAEPLQEIEEEQQIEEVGSFIPRESAPSAAAQNCTKPQPIRVSPQPGRNELCNCGSGIKYKRCCANKPKSGSVPQAA